MTSRFASRSTERPSGRPGISNGSSATSAGTRMASAGRAEGGRIGSVSLPDNSFIDIVEVTGYVDDAQLDLVADVLKGGGPAAVEGGAIAHGHPIGATGAVLATRLMHSMQRDGLARGVVTLCIGGGQGIALAIEML